jgi:hypothetical protein
VQRDSLLRDCRFSSDDPAAKTQLNSSSSLTTAPDASVSAIGTLKARPPRLIGRPSAKIPKRPTATIARGIAEANYGL